MTCGKYSYTENLVAYIDIIGWKEATKGSTISNEVQNALDIIDDVLANIQGGKIEYAINPDAVLISMPADEYTVGNICSIGNLCRRLLAEGFLCAGGIIKGLCYHEGIRVFGPAINKVAEMEQSNKFPRILCSESIVYLGNQPSYYNSSLIMSDIFGRKVVNLFPSFKCGNQIILPEEQEIKHDIEKIRAIIKDRIVEYQTNTNPDYEKYLEKESVHLTVSPNITTRF